MSDAKKIVIKVNRLPVQRNIKLSGKAPGRVVEWHIKRIVGVLLLAILLLIPLLIIVLDYLSYGQRNSVSSLQSEAPEKNLTVDEKQSMRLVKKDSVLPNKMPQKVYMPIVSSDNTVPLISDSTQEAVKIKTDIKEQSIVPSIVHHNIERALLVREVLDREPIGEIKTPIRVENDEATGIFYFTEIVSMKGRIFYHQWWRENQLVYKRPVNVRSDRWRVASSKLFGISSIGHWTVRLTDKMGTVYNEMHFEVIAG